MALNLRLDYKAGQWPNEIQKATKLEAAALTKAMKDTANAAVSAGRAQIAAAGFSQTWVKSIVSSKSAFRPQSGVSLDPSAWIHSRINYADVFEKGANISASSGHFLWLPLPAVPAFRGTGIKFGGVVGRPHMTISQYIRNVGPLIFVKRPGKKPLAGTLVNVPRPQSFTRPIAKAKLTRTPRRTRATVKQFVPLYVGFTDVTLPHKYDVTAAIERVGDHFGDFYLAVLKDMGLI